MEALRPVQVSYTNAGPYAAIKVEDVAGRAGDDSSELIIVFKV